MPIKVRRTRFTELPCGPSLISIRVLCGPVPSVCGSIACGKSPQDRACGSVRFGFSGARSESGAPRRPALGSSAWAGGHWQRLGAGRPPPCGPAPSLGRAPGESARRPHAAAHSPCWRLASRRLRAPQARHSAKRPTPGPPSRAQTPNSSDPRCDGARPPTVGACRAAALSHHLHTLI
jgi:hypothetical protein